MKRIVFFGLVFLGFQAVFSQIPMEQNMTNLEKKQSSVLEEKLLKKLKEKGLIIITTYRDELGHTRNIYKTTEC